VTSRRRQHERLRYWSTWTLTQILLDPGERGRRSGLGMVGYPPPQRQAGLRIVGQPEGLGFGVSDGWHNPTELISWWAIREVAVGPGADA